MSCILKHIHAYLFTVVRVYTILYTFFNPIQSIAGGGGWGEMELDQ